MEGTIAEWLVNKGDKVEKGDPIVELETDKVNVEVHSEYTGVIVEILSGEGDDVEVGDVIGKLDENAEAGDTPVAEESVQEEAKEEKVAEPAPKAEEESVEASPGEFIASPAARKRARELNIDLSEITPRDPLGRIRPEDVEAAQNKPVQEKMKPAAESKSEKTEFDKPVERVKMSRRRQTIAKRLVEAQHTAAMLTTFNEVDMTAIMELRKERQENFVNKHGIKLGFMSFFTKAVVGALKEFPYLNAEIQDNEIVLKEFYDIGVAVSAEDGLVVPVVRDADKLDFASIEREIGNLAVKARENKLGLADLQGGKIGRASCRERG